MFRSIFCAPSRNFKILAICHVLAHRKSYEHGFVKKCDSHKLYTKLRVESVSIDFSCTVSEFQNTGHSQLLAYGRSYKNGFVKKCDGHTVCTKSSAKLFDLFSVLHLRTSKY
ncbi:hypothetical protein BHM03_00057096 [Ensete ventricosum]|nr:hypothetical protein BHM03_00057096 [Ensete ventricosum]